MWKYFKALMYFVTGRISKARGLLLENTYVMATTYDKAIAGAKGKIETVKEAVTELVAQEQELVLKIKGFDADIQKMTKIKAGAQEGMQRRVNTLKDTKSKEEILADPDFIRHKKAFEDVSVELKTAQDQFSEKDRLLQSNRAKLATYKAQLLSMQRQTEALRSEKNEALADVAIAKQSESINAILAGISTDTADEDLREAREAVNRAKARAKVAADLAQTNVTVADNEYLRMAEQREVSAELDNLLDWGDSKEEPLQPAKIAE